VDTKLYTQCPQCDSVFTIEVGQLLSAEGKVQCGVCFCVFEAPDHFVLPQDRKKTPPPAVSNIEPPKEKIYPPTPKETKLIDDILNKSIQIALGEDLAEGEPPAKQTAPSKEPPKEQKQKIQPVAPAVKSETKSKTKKQSGELLSKNKKAIALDPDNLDNATLIYLDENTVKKRRSRRLKSAIVIFSLFAVTIGLAGQYLWQNRIVLSQKVSLRPWYESACEYMQCDLPPLRAVKKIDVMNSQARYHPQKDNFVTIDIVLINNARFSQPFPGVEVVFTHPSKNSLSSHFLPKDYLSYINMQSMMPNVPVQISVEAKPVDLNQLSYEVRLF